MSLKNWEEWIFSHACIVASLTLVSVGLGALGGRIMGEWIYLFIAALWLFAAGVYSAFSTAFRRLGDKKVSPQSEPES